MADEAEARPIVTGGRRWLADMASQLLEPDERDAVRGDHAELGVTGGRALREVLGLVLWRQAALWTHWRPWLGIAAVAIPIGLLLSHVSRWWADSTSIYASIYFDLWTRAFIENPGARRELFGHAANFLVRCIALLGWSWTSGYVLGSLSRRTLWLTGTLFCLLVVFGTYGSTTAARGFSPNDRVFSVTFYGFVFPRLMRIVLVLLPALLGMRRGFQQTPSKLAVTLLWAPVIVMATVWTAHGLENSLIFGSHVIPSNAGLDGITGTADDPRPLRLLPLLMVWPVTYMFANATWHRWRRTV